MLSSVVFPKPGGDIIIVCFNPSFKSSSIILSAPGFGKTTLLRDIIRQLTDIYRKNVVLIDERCEIAACVNGVPCNDIGCRTDVLDGCNKLTGVYMAVRSLSPQVVAMDEIGGEDDIKAVKYCIYSNIFN